MDINMTNSAEQKLKYEVERLLNYGLEKGLILEEDVFVTRNTLLDHFKLSEPFDEAVESEVSITDILDSMIDLSFEKGLLLDNSLTVRDLEASKIMGFLTPRQSQIAKEFTELAKADAHMATEYFYRLSKDTNYIQTARIEKNICWISDTKYGPLEITVNLSKPEKDPKEIAAAKLAPQSSYPKCLLCAENAGYAGGLNHPGRQNHRIVPIRLLGEKWYFQYSPYLYYNEHSIVLREKHTPMKMGERTFKALLEFVSLFKTYFIGSNADLPIVGGSILSHDHFQAGKHKFPIESAPALKSFVLKEAPDTSISVIKWPLSTIRLKSLLPDEIVKTALLILDKWREYTDEYCGIYAYTEENGAKTPHNTVTPIARRVGDFFVMDVVLRNNRTTKEFPLGIFHPHGDVHHIKKENIGLIEVMGLAILPPRLKDEMEEISAILMGQALPSDLGQSLKKHSEWIGFLVDKYGRENGKEASNKILKDEIGVKFARVLEDSGVYKMGEYDKLYTFLESIGFKEKSDGA